ncbi:hypothetical protein BH0034 [Borrelia hermsii DAH]|uniref:Borrelia membrane protein P13 n=3 Tax=Borrelia hermsii TaxID=140 RepID=A0AA34R3E7_BORHD|nr:hypothetical protein BH0034 [Borrelia hermsii DAH]
MFFMKKVLILMIIVFCTVVGFAQSYDEMASSSVEKMLLYEAYKKDPLIPFLLNCFVGFGIGSLAQGDITGGLLILGFDALGLGLLSYGAYSMVNSISASDGDKTSVVALSLVVLGGVTMTLTRLVEVILPFTHASSYNRRLQENLGITLGGFQPEVDMSFDEDARFMFELSFIKRY